MVTQNSAGGPAAAAGVAGASFAEIYDKYADFVWRNARRYGVPESSADDVVQEVFIVVQRRLADYDGRAPMRSWIFGILVHVVHNQRRIFRRKEARLVSLEQSNVQAIAGVAAGLSPSEHAETAERLRLVDALLGQLDEDKRILLVLSELEEWTLREIAEHLGSNVNTVYSRLRVAKREFERLYRRRLAQRGDLP